MPLPVAKCGIKDGCCCCCYLDTSYGLHCVPMLSPVPTPPAAMLSLAIVVQTITRSFLVSCERLRYFPLSFSLGPSIIAISPSSLTTAICSRRHSSLASGHWHWRDRQRTDCLHLTCVKAEKGFSTGRIKSPMSPVQCCTLGHLSGN